MNRLTSLMASAALLLASAALPWTVAANESAEWSGYLDYAYIYSSSSADALVERLEQYANESGISLERYVSDYFETLAPLDEGDDETAVRRKAIAYLLRYLASGDEKALGESVETIRELDNRLERHENRYWYHYIHAHHALERGYEPEFVEHLMHLWLNVVVPLESTYETLDTLSLSDTANSGFVSALPYLYENAARLVLLRSQEMGMDRGLDPLGAIVRLLADRRVGAYPDVIPASASSKGYLDRIVERLNGPESDDGSLTFTLALFEAAKHHDRARGLLANDGLSDETVRAMRRTAHAYEVALNRAESVQGECAVYTRVLRQLGELYAARQRLGVDPEIDIPFSIEGAFDVYVRMHKKLGGGWSELGYRNVHRQAYLDAMHRLWEEIQETSLNAADFYLTQTIKKPRRADEHARNAARVFTRYLTFFFLFALEKEKEAVPDSAYFAAFEAARGVGDAYLSYAAEPTGAEIEMGTLRYRDALMLFPFDREIWPAITAALGRHGRESEYAGLMRPIAERVVRSRAINTWIENREPYADRISALRRGLSDSLVIMYLGFADASELSNLEAELVELSERRVIVTEELEALERELARLRSTGPAPSPAAAADGVDEEGPDPSPLAPLALADVARGIADKNALLTKIDQQIDARSRALPLYKETLETDGLNRELRARRDHPVHALLGRMYHEGRVPSAGETE